MMNKYLKLGIIFSAGVASGYAVGYFVTSKRAEVELSDQINKTREHYKNAKAAETYIITNNFDNESPDIQVLPTALQRGNETKYNEMYTKNSDVVEPPFKQVQFEDLVPEDSNPNDEDVEEEAIAEEIELENDHEAGYFSELLELQKLRSEDTPYVISIGEFMDTDSDKIKNYDKMVLSYWNGDDTLCDEGGTVITDVNAVVGKDSLKMFGKFSTNENIVHVRNDRFDCDYEIHYNEESFTDGPMFLQ